MSTSYTFLEPIGPSAHGYVWKALNSQGKLVAIKVSEIKSFTSPDHHKDDPRVEAAILQQIPPHPNIVSLVDQFEHDGFLCLVYKYCNLGDAFELVSKKNGLPLETKKNMFHQIVQGLQQVHAADIAHLDISLENVFCQKKQYRLGDFGLAQSARGNITRRLGKTAYMAPEIAIRSLQPADYDKRSGDMYSLGVLLFILLFNHQPYEVPDSCDPGFYALMTQGVGRLCSMYGQDDVLIAEQNPELVCLLQHLLVLPSLRISIHQVADYLKLNSLL